jgi:hypothetical protein
MELVLERRESVPDPALLSAAVCAQRKKHVYAVHEVKLPSAVHFQMIASMPSPIAAVCSSKLEVLDNRIN